jgi:type I restriction enzyme S subunit
LQSIQIPLPPIETQHRIAAILDKVQTLIAARKEQIAVLDKLAKDLFVDMFGDPVENPMGWKFAKWGDLFNTTTGKLDSNAMVDNGRYPFFTCAKEAFRIDDYAFDCEALLLAGNNAAAVYDVKHYSGKFNAYQRTYVITLKNAEFSYFPFKFMLEQKLGQMRQLSKGTNTKYLTMTILNDFDFIVPSIELQQRYTTNVQTINSQKSRLTESLAELETMYKSLTQRAFAGELFES